MDGQSACEGFTPSGTTAGQWTKKPGRKSKIPLMVSYSPLCDKARHFLLLVISSHLLSTQHAAWCCISVCHCALAFFCHTEKGLCDTLISWGLFSTVLNRPVWVCVYFNVRLFNPLQDHFMSSDVMHSKKKMQKNVWTNCQDMSVAEQWCVCACVVFRHAECNTSFFCYHININS